MGYKPRKNPRIKEKEFVSILREEFARSRGILKMAFRGIHYSSVNWYWFNKRKSRVGECWRNSRTIYFTKDYLEGKRPIEDFRLCIRHELVHLVAPAGEHHGKEFLGMLELLGGHRYAGQPAYEKPKKK